MQNTKVIDLTSNTQPPVKKKIEFVSYLNSIKGSEKIMKTLEDPHEYDCIELICRNYVDGMDIMFAYNECKRSEGYLCFGHFNDGVV